jgi:hypothetical protein
MKKFVLIMKWLPFTEVVAVADTQLALEQHLEKIMVEVDQYHKDFHEWNTKSQAGVEKFAKNYAELKGIPEAEKNNFIKAMSDYSYYFDGQYTRMLIEMFKLSEHPPVFIRPVRHKFAYTLRCHYLIEEVEFVT